MNECSSIGVNNTYSNLSDQTKFRLNAINKIKDYFNSEIQKRKIMSKKLTKYIAAFDYFDKALIVLLATSGGISVGVPVGIASPSFSLIFSLTTKIIKKLLGIRRNKKEKHNKIVTLDKSKLNSIEILIHQALIDLEISREQFKTIVIKKEKYDKMKKDIRMIKSADELGENNKKYQRK